MKRLVHRRIKCGFYSRCLFLFSKGVANGAAVVTGVVLVKDDQSLPYALSSRVFTRLSHN